MFNWGSVHTQKEDTDWATKIGLQRGLWILRHQEDPANCFVHPKCSPKQFSETVFINHLLASKRSLLNQSFWHAFQQQNSGTLRNSNSKRCIVPSFELFEGACDSQLSPLNHPKFIHQVADSHWWDLEVLGYWTWKTYNKKETPRQNEGSILSKPKDVNKMPCTIRILLVYKFTWQRRIPPLSMEISVDTFDV